MKIFTTLLLIILTNIYSSSQSELDEIVDNFMITNNLSYKKLEKLESIRVKYSAESEKWRDAYLKWDDHLLTKSYTIHESLIKNQKTFDYVPGDEMHHYSTVFLIHLVNEMKLVNALSDRGVQFLKNVIYYKRGDDAKLLADIELIKKSSQVTSACKVANQSIIDDICNFRDIDKFINAGSSGMITAAHVISNMGDSDLIELKRYITNNQIGKLIIESNQDGKKFGSSDGFAMMNRIESNESITDWEPYYFYKWNLLIDDTVIGKLLVYNALMKKLKEYNDRQLNTSELGQFVALNCNLPLTTTLQILDSNKEFGVSCYQAIYSYDRPYLHNAMILAYNNIYLDYQIGNKRVQHFLDSTDIENFDLTIAQNELLTAISSTDTGILKSAITKIIAADPLDTLFNDAAFQLATHIVLNRKAQFEVEWIRSNFVSNPVQADSTIELNALSNDQLVKFKRNIAKILCQYDHCDTTIFLTFGQYGAIDSRVKLSWNCRRQLSALVDEIPYQLRPKYMKIMIHSEGRQTISERAPLSNRDNLNNTYLEDPHKTVYPPLPAPPVLITPQKVNPVTTVQIVDFPDVEASFPGGNVEMKRWIMANLQYPETSRELGDQGRVYVNFIVETDGSISVIDVMQGGLTDELNKEAIRLVQSMPKWSPGEVKGVPIRTHCRLPIPFILQ